MKNLKKCLSLVLSLVLLLTLLPAMGIPTADAATVSINSTNFPDANFREYVRNEFDTDGNGSLSTSELSAADYISCSDSNITSLKGIEYFTSLDFLDCSCNRLTSLDVSKNTRLTYLSCYDNQLTALDVSKNTLLDALFCSGNQLTALNVRNNRKLVLLSVFSNRLEELDIRNNPNLVVLMCEDNRIRRIDLRNNPILEDTIRYGTRDMDYLFVDYERELPDGELNKSVVDFDKGTALVLSDGSVFGVNPFDDVPEGKYYYAPVMWALFHDPQVTGGTDATHFSPNKTCTREQIVTFLWKACGAPEPKSTYHPFTDVKPGKYYEKAVLWAVENKITGGVSATTFGVGKPCTREQAVTFLWKACGSPNPVSSNNPFVDVNPSKYYYKAVLWAVENNITSGTSASLFGVGKSCTRGQIVTFLYKAIGQNGG